MIGMCKDNYKDMRVCMCVCHSRLIKYFPSFSSQILTAVSRALGSILCEMWPLSLGEKSTPQTWQTVHHVWMAQIRPVHKFHK